MQAQHAVSKTSNCKLDYDHLVRKQTVCAGSPAATQRCENQLLMPGNTTPGKIAVRWIFLDLKSVFTFPFSIALSEHSGGRSRH
jgi:hypothetical protein